MNKMLETLMERVDSWPKEAQDELVRSILEIEAKHQGTYELSDEEWEAIQKGLAQAERGEFVSDEDMAAFFKRHGL